MAMKLIVFVCVSNTCRSPMCEYLMREKITKSGLSGEFAVVSRSLSENYEPQNSPANEQGQLVLKNEYGIDMASHRSKLLSSEDVDNAFMIIPVKRELGEYIKQLHPGAGRKIKNLSMDVMDPWRQPYPVYLHCARTVDGLLAEVLSDISKSTEL